MFDGDRLHRECVAIAIGEVDREGFILKGHEDSSDLAPLEFDGLVGFFVCGPAGVRERDEVVILDECHWV